ncbi:AAA-16 domain-containing protein [Mycena venus]|uniref:AAA-16 domain-containing protein n=1 Tax=Mycena venus TaxID=2733690 RepID=A0A8H6Z6A1_9AGAR|nr:AAA-16 domain-containing protein [Mycena venus]
MPREAGESQEVNNIYISQISGGTGGAGGSGGQEGGYGGVGEGPNFRATTMNLAIQNYPPDTRLRPPLEPGGSEGAMRDLFGATRNFQREIGARYWPYAGFDPQRPISDSRASSSTQSPLALNPFSHYAPQLDPRGNFPPHSGPYQHPIDQASLDNLLLLPSQNHDFFPTFEYPDLPHSTRSIHCGAFITADTIHHRPGGTGINILHRAVALEALYDSADSFPQPRCHPETRTKMLNALYNWAIENHDDPENPEEDEGDTDNSDEDERDTDNSDEDERDIDNSDEDVEEEDYEDDNNSEDIYISRSICWLHGPAGAGKSAIMQTLCQKLQAAGQLGGAFFFKRGHATRGNSKVLFATLAYQLAEHNHDLKPLISQVVEDSPSLVARHMEVQLLKLIVEPCQSLTNSSPLILLIDGLDECETQKSQAEILQLIGNTVRNHPKAFRFLIASRTEAHIREAFDDSSFDETLDSVNVCQSFEDVKKYFNDQFARISHEHGHIMTDVPTPWPSPDVVDSLVHKSSGYFVYASTVIKFIDDKKFRPMEQLALVLGITSTDSEAPFEALDQLVSLFAERAGILSKLTDFLDYHLEKHG